MLISDRIRPVWLEESRRREYKITGKFSGKIYLQKGNEWYKRK